ncbi:phosphotransferase enzyme family protein [Robiginitalea sediminis]|uniref:phosphotransferase enzyme family protein n=1 Tax=Robiginitalea sediminis TaxID=1982593 RepID=UPI000B4AE71C|nr:aminoglycoside phosphotransferase family protein [Robiginitalea sediminis]
MDTALTSVLHRYGIRPGQVEPLEGGLINQTFKVWEDGQPAYILQRLNSEVFPQPEAMMDNMKVVLPHLKGPGYATVELMQTSGGNSWVSDPELGFWRVFSYIPGTRTYPNSSDPAIAREAGRILGQFHLLLRDVPVEHLSTPLPGFHDLEKRFRELVEAEGQAAPDRKREASAWLELATSLTQACRDIPLKDFPLRICHNDPVMKNILFREDRPEALCLIDLDTLMPGVLLWDFGDAVRSVVTVYPEDYRGEDPIVPDLEAYAAFTRGFMESGVEITPSEQLWLHWGLVLMPLLHGIRALADFLAGDVYYQITYREQNLVRARNLLSLAEASKARIKELRNLTQVR